MDKWGVCNEPGCPVLTDSAWCAAHRPPAWSGSNRGARLPAGWQQIRLRVLRRDRYTCVICGDPADEVDHRVPGDDHRLENLQSLCHPCHVKKTAADKAAGYRRSRYE